LWGYRVIKIFHIDLHFRIFELSCARHSVLKRSNHLLSSYTGSKLSLDYIGQSSFFFHVGREISGILDIL
jgi:hypothetical protein